VEQDEAINELLEIEEDLQFAMLRQADLVRLQFELLANPYYNDVSGNTDIKLPYTFTLFERFDTLSDSLVASCKKEVENFAPRILFYKRAFKSFNNVYVNWLTVQETGSLTPAKVGLKELQDRH
jgi:hypothetical protein